MHKTTKIISELESDGLDIFLVDSEDRQKRRKSLLKLRQHYVNYTYYLEYVRSFDNINKAMNALKLFAKFMKRKHKLSVNSRICRCGLRTRSKNRSKI